VRLFWVSLNIQSTVITKYYSLRSHVGVSSYISEVDHQQQQQQQAPRIIIMAGKATEIIIIDDDSEYETTNSNQEYDFYLPGKPITLRRPRFFQKGIWNSNKKEMTAFQAAVKSAVPAVKNGVLFEKDSMISIKMVFYLPRPAGDFVGGRRRPGNLKPSSIMQRFFPIYPDIDNLIKFVFDALNKLVFEDDKQVVKLVAYKLRDNNMSCDGGTRITMSKLDCEEGNNL